MNPELQGKATEMGKGLEAHTRPVIRLKSPVTGTGIDKEKKNRTREVHGVEEKSGLKQGQRSSGKCSDPALLKEGG